MRRLVVLLTMLALAGCGGGKHSPRARSATTTSRAAGGTTSTTATASAAAGTTIPGATRTTAAAAGAATTSTTTGPPPTSGAPLAANAIQPPRPGTYTLDQTGTSHVRGCATVDQPAPSPVSERIDPANGNRQQTVIGGGSQGASTTTVLEYRADGVYLAYLKQDQPGLGSFEFRPDPPVLAAPAHPTVGKTWHFVLHSTDGKITADTTIAIQSVDAQTVRSHTTAHVTGQSTLGPLDIQLDTVDDTSPAFRLIVQSTTHTTGTAGLCRVDSTIQSKLRSTTPS
jgi:hypothetical protein